MHVLRMMFIVASIVLLAGAAQAQVASALVAEGEPLPEAPDYFVAGIDNPAVVGVDGWGFNLDTQVDGAAVAAIYGTYGAAVPGVLYEQLATDVYTQNNWESFWGLSDDGVCISATCTRNDDQVDGLDSVWYLDTVVAIEEEPYPNEDGFWWSFGSRPEATRDGVPYFVGGITDEQGGSTDKRGLFYGFDNQAVIIGGMMIGGLDNPVVDGSAAVSFDYRYSAYGTNYLAEVATETGSSTNDNSMVLNGAVVLVDGQPVTEGSPLPEAAGGLPGENWDNFDFCGITEDGQWLLTGDTDNDSAIDEFVMVNGLIVLREGDEIDGFTLAGGISGGYMNEQGDWAVIWDVDTLDDNVECLILNGQLLLMEGMPVDIDGDGVVDEGTELTDFTGISALVLADRDEQGRAKAYFTADVDVPAGVRSSDPVFLSRDEADGLDEDYVEPASDRLEKEFGFVLVPEGTVAIDPDNLPGDEAPRAVLALDQNYPNPFNPQTSIAFNLVRSGQVRLDVFNLQGRLVRTLVDESRAAGAHTVVWSGTDEAGRSVPAGTYLYRLDTGDRVLSRTMVLVK